MSTVTTIYENGIFRPLEKVNLPESSHISISIPDAPATPVSPALAAIYDAMSFHFDSGHHDTAEPRDGRADHISISQIMSLRFKPNITHLESAAPL